MSSESSSAAAPAKHADSSSRLPVTKVTALARLKTFTGTVISRKDKGTPIVFPPPSWDLDDKAIHESLWSRKGNKKVAQAPVGSNSVKESEEHPEPMTFAKKIRAMIELLPVPSALASTLSIAPATAPEITPADEGRTGSPIPPGMDDGMIKMLSSEDLMNGKRSNKKGVERQSVWDTLAGINHDVDDHGISQRPRPSKVEEQEDGIMMYVPLEPNEGSEVELAETESVLEYDKTPSHKRSQSALENDITSEEPKPALTDVAVEKKVWVPSTTQISVFTTWWGYRLYLPPPIMEKLGSHSLKATARAAMITSALKWLLGKIPMMFVPAQLKPAVALLKRLSPVVGYVGIFIAWSWDRVRACDEGLLFWSPILPYISHA
jgi:hypothetical protein